LIVFQTIQKLPHCVTRKFSQDFAAKVNVQLEITFKNIFLKFKLLVLKLLDLFAGFRFF